MQKKSVAYEMPMKAKINNQTNKLINYKKAQLKTPKYMHPQQQEGHYCNLHADLFPK
jgi:hypothetical protein